MPTQQVHFNRITYEKQFDMLGCILFNHVEEIETESITSFS